MKTAQTLIILIGLFYIVIQQVLLWFWKHDLCYGQKPGFCAGEERRAVNQVFTVRSPHNIWRVWPERDTAPPPPRHFYAERASNICMFVSRGFGKNKHETAEQ